MGSPAHLRRRVEVTNLHLVTPSSNWLLKHVRRWPLRPRGHGPPLADLFHRQHGHAHYDVHRQRRLSPGKIGHRSRSRDLGVNKKFTCRSIWDIVYRQLRDVASPLALPRDVDILRTIQPICKNVKKKTLFYIYTSIPKPRHAFAQLPRLCDAIAYPLHLTQRDIVGGFHFK